MANEAYDRLKQCIQTREAGIRTIWAAQVTQPGLTARAVSSDGLSFARTMGPGRCHDLGTTIAAAVSSWGVRRDPSS